MGLLPPLQIDFLPFRLSTNFLLKAINNRPMTLNFRTLEFSLLFKHVGRKWSLFLPPWFKKLWLKKIQDLLVLVSKEDSVLPITSSSIKDVNLSSTCSQWINWARFGVSPRKWFDRRFWRNFEHGHRKRIKICCLWRNA